MDVNRLIEGFLGGRSPAGPASGQGGTAARGSMPSGLVGGAAAGGLVALLAGSKTGRKLGGKALKYGGMAAVAGLAYKAYSDWQSDSATGATPAATPQALPKPAPGQGFDIDTDTDARGDDFRLVVLRAMISASLSDGHVDREEHQRIRTTIDGYGLAADEKSALYDYFSAPADPAAIAGLARTEEQKAEIYLASALSIDPDTEQERAYLDTLSAKLGLPNGLRDHLDYEAEAARAQVA